MSATPLPWSQPAARGGAGGPRLLARWFLAAAWRAQRGRWVAAAAAIAIGIALAVAIFSVNRSALVEFQEAIATVNGEAQLQVLPRSGTFAEETFATVARAPGVTAASPVLEGELALPGRAERLAVIGVDPLRAAGVTPALVPRVALPSGGSRDDGGGSGSPLFDADAVFLSPAALGWLGLRVGDTLVARAGLAELRLRVAGTVDAGAGRRLAAMDIGTAQWRLGSLGRLSRVDLRLAEGESSARAAQAIAALLPADATVAAPSAREQRMSNVSRAYRVNLNVLALVALFTGAFLVFSAVGLSAVRQRPQLALMSVLGASRGWLQGTLIAQGAAVAAAGTAVGIPLGLLLAGGLLAWVGGDLGGGFFAGTRPELRPGAAATAGFALLGVGVGVAAAWLPAREAARAPAARALKSASDEQALARLSRSGPALALAAAAIALSFAPPVAGLPIPAYVAIALGLLAGIAAVPFLVETAFGWLARAAGGRAWPSPPAWLALQRVARAPGQAAGTIAGVVASFALTVAMVIMVASFRDSVAEWLDTVLPADVYGRAPAAAAGSGGALDPALQAAILAVPGVRSAEFSRSVELSLDPAQPAVAVLARPIAAAEASRTLPITGSVLDAPAGTVPVYVSEPMVDLHGFSPGRTVALPFGPPGTRYFVAAVWRDYARQFGAVAIDAADWRRLTGDATASDVAIRLADGASAGDVTARLRAQVPALAGIELRSAQELRRLSLAIFDRSFAMTYLLEAAALVVAVFGIATAYAGQALARAREFGVLRHLGVTRAQIGRQIAIEGGLLTAFGAAWGGALGFAIGLVLIHRVNPQSFHWTMELRMPWGPILGSALLLALSGAVAAVLAARAATADSALSAVREDW
jgi:putative ABC transport system permease protein